MLKLGIYKATQDTPLGHLWRRGLTSASLLVGEGDSVPDLSRFERIIEHVQLSNGVARTTSRGRFDNLDHKINDFLASSFGAETPLEVEELAASTGYTGYEWYLSLKQIFPTISFCLSDRLLFVVEVKDTENEVSFIVEPNGEPIQYVRPPFVVSLVSAQSWLYPVNRVVQKQGAREWSVCRVHFEYPAEWHSSALGTSVHRKDSLVMRRIPLLHPQVLQAIDSKFKVKEHSIFDPLDRAVDVIRTMNILNRSYFSDSQLHSASGAIWNSLRPNGFWIVGRTVDESKKEHDVTLYRKTESGWKSELTVGNGTEIDSLVRNQFIAQEVGNVRVGERD